MVPRVGDEVVYDCRKSSVSASSLIKYFLITNLLMANKASVIEIPIMLNAKKFIVKT